MNKRKKMVVDHAQALFLEKGIQQTSIQDIIERAGISKGTFYNYFSSKHECVSAILEQVRNDATLYRIELQLEKDRTDIHLLIEQISIISRVYDKRGVSRLLEEIFHSADHELKKLVLNFRLFELEWFANRLVDVFGPKLKPHALEAAVIFYGIQQHLLFTGKILNQRKLDFNEVAASVFHYMKSIIPCLINDQTSVLDSEKIIVLKSNLIRDTLRKEELLLLFDELIESNKLTKPQMDLTTALRAEIEQEPLRNAVISALLQPFLEIFKGSELFKQARELMGLTWLYRNQDKIKK